MDIAAVVQSHDKELEDLGLVKKGDILGLRGFCERQMRKSSEEETKRQLVTELLNKKKTKQRKTIANHVAGSKQPQGKVKTRKIQIGWLHFDDDHQKYISVRLQKGGGSRVVDVPLDADVQQIIQIAEEIFFSNGICIFGALEDMEVSLANFKCETFQMSTSEGDSFTLQHYINACKTTRVRLYLKTAKKISCAVRQASDQKASDQARKDDESELLVPVFSENQREATGDQIIGTSMEREEIRKEQEQEFAQSLAMDKLKEEKRRRELCSEIEKASRQLHLKQARLHRVEPEPDEFERKVDVSVRHPVLGLISRPFHVFSTMAAVYDWVGSLCLTPEQFGLSGFDGKCLLPSLSVQVAERTMLYMSACDNAPNLIVEDDEINFQGFGATCNEVSLDDTLPLDSSTPQSSQRFSIPPVSVSPPIQLMDEDDTGSPERTSLPQQIDSTNTHFSEGEQTRATEVNDVTNGASPSSDLPLRKSRRKRTRNDPGRQFRMMVNTLYGDAVSSNEQDDGNPVTEVQERRDCIQIDDIGDEDVVIAEDRVDITPSTSEDQTRSIQETEVISSGLERITHPNENMLKLQDELRALATDLFSGSLEDPANRQLINIRRRKLWQDACRAFGSPSFQVSRGIRVHFIGEAGVDGGGPRREFYRLLLTAACTMAGLLEGNDGRKVPMHNCAAINAGKFQLLGMMAGMSMIDGGPGLPIFAESVFHYLARGTPLVGEVEDVPDPSVRKNLSELRLVQTTEDLRNMVSGEDFAFLLDCGFSKPLALLQLADRDEVVECAIVHYTHYRIRGELDQLKEGLAKVGVLEAIKRNPDLFKPLFCWDSSLQVTTEYIRRLFVPKLSEVGSNARSHEEDLLYNWEEYLKEIDDEGRARASETEVTLGDLFAFLTGSHSIPPMGFERTGSIVFIPLENPQESRLPSVSTCLPQLSIPVCNYLLEDFENFKKQMNLAVLGSMEFGQP